MTKIYIVRHCEAIGNLKRFFQGTTDFDITETGAKQLDCLRERFKDIKLDKIYTSPLIRTQKTAEALQGGRDIEIEVCEGLIELDGGVLEGRPVKEAFASVPGLLDTWHMRPEEFQAPNGEAMSHAYGRIWDAVSKLASENKGKTIACAGHGGVFRSLICKIMHNDINKLKTMPWLDNTAVSLIEVDDNSNYNIVFLNDISHLPEELTPKKTDLTSFVSGEEK